MDEGVQLLRSEPLADGKSRGERGAEVTGDDAADGSASANELGSNRSADSPPPSCSCCNAAECSDW
jgi:hypothetical protein